MAYYQQQRGGYASAQRPQAQGFSFGSFNTGNMASSAALKDFTNLTPTIRNHLKNVYATLALAMVSASVGSYWAMVTGFHLAPFLSILATIGLTLAIHATPHKMVTQRVLMANLLAFVMGASLAPLLSVIVMIDPSIITTALVGSIGVFASFTGAALFAERRSYMFLGGILGSAMNFMFFTSILSIFFGFSFFMDLRLYLGLFVMSGFVIYDTQVIVERAGLGHLDFVADAVNLFVDFVGIFVRLLIILAKNNDGKDRRRNNNRR